MSTRGKRLDSIEDQRDRALDRRMRGWSNDELLFHALYGFGPERLCGELPPRLEYTLFGIKITITSEWESEEHKTCKSKE